MNNPEKLATLGTKDTRHRQTKQKTQHNMCWTPPLDVIVGHHHEELLLDTIMRRYCWTPPLGVIVGHHHEALLLDTTIRRYCWTPP